MRIAICIGVAAALACGSGTGGDGTSSGGTASASGTINRRQVTLVDAASAVVPLQYQGVSFQGAGVLLSSVPDICVVATTGKQPRSLQSLVIGLTERQGTTLVAPTGPGAFDVVTGLTGAQRAAVAFFRVTDNLCVDVPDADAIATGGQVQLTSVGATYTGSFTLTFPTGESVTGSFRAPACPGIATILQEIEGGSAPPCQ
jgi:hypothetical protein